MRTTGPILAIGAITFANQAILHNQPIDWRVPAATLLAAAVFAGAEKVWEPGAVGAAYVALVTTLFIPLDKSLPAPAASLGEWVGKTSPAARPRYVYT